MLNVRRVILKFLLKPLKMEYSMCSLLYDMKTLLLMILCMFCLMLANTAEVVAVAVGSQQPTLNYKQQLQYQMQQHDKYEYQQHIKQQQQYYQQQYHQQPTPTALALLQQEQLQQQPQPQRHHQPPSSPYLSAKPTQILQTAASLIVDDGNHHHHSDSLALGQPEFTSANGQRRRPGNRKRKRRPQPLNHDDDIVERPTALNSSPPYWRGQIEDDKKIPETEGVAVRPSLQASFKRRKQPAIREPLAALEKEQKLYEMRNKPENFNGNNPGNSRTSADLKNILKNSGGLSLSEILQQKNLSLDDLLKGKQNALQALQTTAMAPVEKTKYPAFKPSFKISVPSVKLPESSGSEERSKLNALHRLKLFGSSSRPSGLQVGLADHLTTRRKEGNLYSSTTASPTTTTTVKPSTTKIPIYKKILHQRPTLKPTLVLKNMAVMATAEPEKVNSSWESKEEEQHKEKENIKSSEREEKENDEEEEADAEEEVEELESEEDTIPETTTAKGETTMTPTTTSTSSTTTTTTTTSTLRPITEKTTNRDIHATTRRMFTSTRGHGRTTYRYGTSTTTTPAPAPPPPPTTSSSSSTTSTTAATPLPMTTTTTTSTTTASSSTMNLTPKANLNLNTEDIRERIQETLLKNLIEKEDSFKKSSMESGDNEDDLENFFEETVKPKTTKAYETSTITTRMKQFSPLYTTSTSSTTTSSTTSTSTSSTTLRPSLDSITTSRENVIPDFDNVDDRTDLLELIEDRRSGNRLFKVLEQRNMTLEELIEHRKRGSSQLHLATIVESPSRFYPDKKVVLQDNMDIVTAFENFPHFNLLNLKSVKPDDIKTDSQGSSYFTSIIDIEPTDEVYKNRKRPSALLAADLDKASLMADRSEKSLGFFPSWKTLALASLATTTTTNNNNNNNNNNKDVYTIRQNNRNSNNIPPFYLQQPKMLLENNNNNNNNNDDDDDIYDIKDNELVLITRDNDEENADEHDNDDDDYQNENPIQAAVRLPEQTAEAIENEVARAHDLVDLELSGHGFKRSPQAAGALLHSQRYGTFYTNMPAGIKSAIVASATIVLTALITFMVIFAVCRWKQRRQRMTNVMKSYNAMKSKMPTIATTATAAAAAATVGAGVGVGGCGGVGGVGGCGMTAALVTNPNSRRSSFRDMHDLLGGSGLSVAATITTTSSGLTNTPILATKTFTNSSSPCLTPILHRTANKTTTPTTTTTTTTNVMTGNNCNKNMLQQHSNYKQNPNNSSSCSSNSNSNSSNSCMGRPLQRQSSLLFQRNANNDAGNNSCLANHTNSKNVKPTPSSSSLAALSSPATNLAILSGCNLLDIKRNNKMNGSTTSLSFSLTNGHNVSNAHINTMDANSPEVQEYLFDTLRNSF